MPISEVKAIEGSAQERQSGYLDSLETLSFERKEVSLFHGKLKYAFHRQRLFYACYQLFYSNLDLIDMVRYIYLKQALLSKYGQSASMVGEDREIAETVLRAVEGLYPKVSDDALYWRLDDGTRALLLRADSMLWIVYFQFDILTGVPGNEPGYDTSGL